MYCCSAKPGLLGVVVEAGSEIHSWSDSSIPLPSAFLGYWTGFELLQALLRIYWERWMCCDSPNFGVGALAQHVASRAHFKVTCGFSKWTCSVIQNVAHAAPELLQGSSWSFCSPWFKYQLHVTALLAASESPVPLTRPSFNVKNQFCQPG